MKEEYKKYIEDTKNSLDTVKKSKRAFEPVSWDASFPKSHSSVDPVEGESDVVSSVKKSHSAVDTKKNRVKPEKVSVYCETEAKEMAEDILRKWKRARRRVKISDIWVAGLKLLYDKEVFFDKNKD
ncbi:hypothetical protein DID80_06960 [Candidatus Marinamargulisbacteria bacterium SCGC AAA071-K20]|nr:hypothetical protein DID80_06960 [Candidatus Marinamargulisbacteria bacterium SCGC AAA071-K20]